GSFNWCRLLVYFFFSSRRRHTRFSRDWSSDVCSSDLLEFEVVFHHALDKKVYKSTYKGNMAHIERHLDFAAWLSANGINYVDISDRKSTRLNSSHVKISYAVFCLKKKIKK